MKRNVTAELRTGAATLVAFGRLVADKFGADNVPAMGAGLAYYTLFAVFPFLLALIALIGFALAAGLPLATDARAYVLQYALNWLPGNLTAVTDTIESVITQRGSVGVSALFVMVITGVAVFGHLRRSLDEIFESPGPPMGIKEFAITWVIHGAIVLAAAFVMVIAMMLDTVLQVIGKEQPLLASVQWLWSPAAALLLFALIVALMTVLFSFVPRVRPPIRDVLPGALLASVMWEIGKAVLAWYLGLQRYGNVYGPLAGTIALLVWIYYNAQIIYVGAVVAAVLVKQNRLADAARAADTNEEAG
ncbi:MAG: YihY/virulence factor BrkB family protein [Anaerolineae bacterium]